MLATAILFPVDSITAQTSFLNWEHPHVSPLALTPNGARLLAVNTPDNRLEVFDVSPAGLVRLDAIAVGLDPVSVRARSDVEAWVVNHVSDTISIVDLISGHVVATLATEDEPADVVFAGNPERAFVSCSQVNLVQVFDLADLSLPPQQIPIFGEEPRALAVSPDGSTVYAAIFESGNGTTILGGDKIAEQQMFPPNVVNHPSGPWGGANPPPNAAGGGFSPPLNPALPAPPQVSHIVRKNDNGRWLDDFGGDWTNSVSGPNAAASGRIVGWDLADYDVAVLDANSLELDYVPRLMNINMSLAVNPKSGSIAVIGTEATNEIRFEPNLTGTFVRVHLALIDPATKTATITDLNSHLSYSVPTIAASERQKSIGDPRGIVFSADGTKAFVTGMGSNNIVVIDAAGNRAGLAPTIAVGEGPTGIVLREDLARLYTLNKFDSSISIVDLGSELEIARVGFHDPSPVAIRVGRKHFYNTIETSGLGQVSCAACHVDGRIDRLAWDLGDPTGVMKSLEGQNLGGNLPFTTFDTFEPFHPMKGPLLTQTMQDIIGHEPFHWRGDKFGIEDFSGAFQSLLGDDETLSALEMQEFEDFLATLAFAPNPNRNPDNSLRTELSLEGHFATGNFVLPAGAPLPNGNPQNGLALFRPPNNLGGGEKACASCHSLPTGYGTNMQWDGQGFVPFPTGPFGEEHMALTAPNFQAMHTARIAPLRNLFERSGFHLNQPLSRSGFGIRHDGSVDGPERSLSQPLFANIVSDQMVADLIAFVKSLTGSDLPVSDGTSYVEPPGSSSLDTHAGVGRQVVLADLGAAEPALQDLYLLLLGEAELDRIGLVARFLDGALERGAYYQGNGLWQTDRAAETLETSALEAYANVTAPLRVTAVVYGSQQRIGVDRDEDGAFDRDEIEAGSDPSDGSDVPGVCRSPLPLAPSALTASGIGANLVQLDWLDNASDETGYRVRRSVSGANQFMTVADLAADAQSFTDISAVCGALYDYRILARNCAGTSSAATIEAVSDGCSALASGVSELSVASGGVQTMDLHTGYALAGESYLVLGSATGTAPSLTLAPGIALPLVFDAYTLAMLNDPNGSLWDNTFGALDAQGRAQAQFYLPSFGPANWAGIQLQHAFVVFEGSTAQFASNSLGLSLVP